MLEDLSFSQRMKSNNGGSQPSTGRHSSANSVQFLFVGRHNEMGGIFR